MLPYAPPNTNANTPLSEETHRSRVARNRLIGRVIFLSLTLGAMMAPVVLGFLFFVAMAYEMDAAQESGPAPAGSVLARRAWGQDRLGSFFERADDWVRKSNQIAADIGEVTRVAPIGAPNSYGESFGEACASLNLQVIGTQGEGVLLLPDGEPNAKAAWIFDGRAYPVFENGSF